MYSSVKKNTWFLIPYAVVAFTCLLVIIFWSKASVHLYLNSFYNDFGDFFFKHLTILGDGIVIPFIVLMLLFIRFRYAFMLLAVYAASGIFTQLLKRILFEKVARPTRFFEGIADLHLVPGVEQLSWKSFPSGHSTTAFAIMICFSFMVKNNFLKMLFFILASLIAYSRVYLSQHFLTDILAGSFIGVMAGLLLYNSIHQLQWKWLDLNLAEAMKLSKKQ